jgi:amino acid adenylation domain-containing protein
MEHKLDKYSIAQLPTEERVALEHRLLNQLSNSKARSGIGRLEDRSTYPLSVGQARLYFLYQLDPSSVAYNQPKILRLSGELKRELLENVLTTILGRHEILRSNFTLQDGIPVQTPAREYKLNLAFFDLSTNRASEREETLRKLIVKISKRPFNLAKDLMLRAALIRLTQVEHVLVLVTHHIVSDGPSRDIIFREIALLYDIYSQNKEEHLSELPLQYGDYAAWQRKRFNSSELEEQFSYWQKQLTNAPMYLHLPVDYPKHSFEAFAGAQKTLVVKAPLAQRLRKLSQNHSVTMFITLLAAFQLLLWRMTGQSDFVVGVPITGRTRPELQRIVGFFVSSLLMRAQFNHEQTFLAFLKETREKALGAYGHPDLPFETLLQNIQPARDIGYYSVFQTFFSYRKDFKDPLRAGSITLTPMEIDLETTKFDLSLSITDCSEELVATFVYDAQLFEAATIERIADCYQVLLNSIVRDPTELTSKLRMLPESVFRQLASWNDTVRDDLVSGWVHELFESQARQTPYAVALISGDQEVTYEQLNYRANQLAHYLKSHGVGSDVLVAICMERSIEAVVAILAVLKAGGAYLPIDPMYPPERLAFIVQDARPGVLITHKKFQKRLYDLEYLTGSGTSSFLVLWLDEQWEGISQKNGDNPISGTTADNLAYVIYTSGSTGEPKGVMISHRGIRNRFLWGQHFYALSGADAVLHTMSLSFDFATWEIFTALLSGARLIVAQPDKNQDSRYLTTLILDHGVTVAGFVPSMLDAVLDEPRIKECKRLRKVFSGGEMLGIDLRDRFVGCLDAELHNTYGPTEASIDVTYWISGLDSETELKRRIVPIGRPIANTQIHILDAYLTPVPIGVPGEICIGGVSLGRGYLRRPDLTAETFIPDPFTNKPGERLYRTGDLARYLSDGAIQFIGRTDHQVKIRGLRIELGEIERILSQHHAILKAAVAVRGGLPGGERLVGYIALRHPVEVSELRSFLSAKLPEYMVPTVFVFLDSLPSTSSGKIDRGALPAPDDGEKFENSYVAPRTTTEKAIARVWADVLKIERVGSADHFFELGGHSLLATKVMARLREIFSIDLPLRSLFGSPTVAGLAERIDNILSTRPQCSNETAEDAETVEL